jgi:hypothetical protein
MRPTRSLTICALLALAFGCGNDREAAASQLERPTTGERPYFEYGLVLRDSDQGSGQVQVFPYAMQSQQNSDPLSVKVPLHRAHLLHVRRAEDQLGLPAFEIEIVPEDDQSFRAYAKQIHDRQMAVLVGGKLITAPTIYDLFPGPMLLPGG